MSWQSVNVRIVSPTIVGGATARELDATAVLRAPSIRGAVRFWTRALAGASFRDVEADLWGDVDRGQRVRVRSSYQMSPSANPHTIIQGTPEHGPVRTKVLEPRPATVSIWFGLPRGADSSLKQAVQAVVWTWLHLGSVGKRSRRGLGSLVWSPAPGDLLDGFVTFSAKDDLISAETLRRYLLRGLTKVAQVFRHLDVTPPAAGVAGAALRASGQWFELRSVSQVFVGNRLALSFDGSARGMEQHLHGFNWNLRGPGEKDELGGHEKERLASPMLWRVFPLTDGAYVPVMTWSPRAVTTISAGTPMYRYLANDLGFTTSLGGQPL